MTDINIPNKDFQCFFQKAEVQWVWVGLRPQRKPIRIEAETINFDGEKLKVNDLLVLFMKLLLLYGVTVCDFLIITPIFHKTLLVNFYRHTNEVYSAVFLSLMFSAK